METRPRVGSVIELPGEVAVYLAPWRLAFIALVVTICTGVAALAQKRTPIPFDQIITRTDFGWLEQTSGPAMTADGQMVAYTTTDPTRVQLRDNVWYSSRGVPTPIRGANLWITHIANGTTDQVNPPDVTAWSPAWSPDGKLLAYYSDESGRVALWVWEKETRSRRQVPAVQPQVRYAIEPIVWADSRHVLINIKRDDKRSITGEAAFRSEAAGPAKGVEIYEWPRPKPKDLPSTIDAPTVAIFNRDVALVDIVTGTAEKLTKDVDLPGNFFLSPDGKHLAISLLQSRREETGSSNYSIVLVDLATKATRDLERRVREHYVGPPMSWSQDGRFLAYSSTGGYADIHEGDVFVFSLANGKTQKVSPDQAHGFATNNRPPVWGDGISIYSMSDGVIWEMSADGSRPAVQLQLPKGVAIGNWRAANNSLIPVVTDAGTRPNGNPPYFLVFATEGTPDKRVTLAYYKDRGWVRLWQGSYTYSMDAIASRSGFSFARDSGAVVFLREAADQPPEFYYAAALGTVPKPITQVNHRLEQYELGAARSISFVNAWGETLYISLLLPPDYDPAKTYPTVVTAYPSDSGGTRINMYGLGLNWGIDAQALATRGYVVAWIDCPIRVGRQTVMKDIADDLVPGVQALIKSGIADPKRIGLIGQSRGGYLVMALLTQTDLFATAISVEPSTVNLPASAGDVRRGVVLGSGAAKIFWIEGNLWENTQAYIQNSPFFYFPKITTPVMVVTGGDSAASIGDQVYGGLAQLDKRVTHVRYFGEGHVPSYFTQSNYRDFLERSIGWLDKYLKSETSAGVNR